MRLYQRVGLAATAIILLMMVPAVGLAASPKAVHPATCTNGVAVSHLAVFNQGPKQHRLEFSVDKAYAGSQWAVVLKHDGYRFWRGDMVASSTGEFNVRTLASNWKGPDSFYAKATNSHNGQVCRSVIVH
jgi:hypothetical protein